MIIGSPGPEAFFSVSGKLSSSPALGEVSREDFALPSGVPPASSVRGTSLQECKAGDRSYTPEAGLPVLLPVSVMSKKHPPGLGGGT